MHYAMVWGQWEKLVMGSEMRTGTRTGMEMGTGNGNGNRKQEQEREQHNTKLQLSSIRLDKP